MVPRKRKYEAGEASNFLTRRQALTKLQLSLKDFRRLCILKGVFPREPRNRKRAQKGNLSKVQTLYYEKDIRFLLHEPIVWKFRDFKVFLRKLKKASEKKNWETVERLKSNKPKYSLDHLVRERYPTFIDAIRDLEDCLCLCFLYATFPKTSKTPVEMTDLCRKLTVEFLHYVIEARALRKVFCSIKGYYFQADIKGQTVTWIVPHSFGFEQPESVDMRVMSIFVEFYTTMLGFINFRLFHSLNLAYPPAIPGLDSSLGSEMDERVYGLNTALKRTIIQEDATELDNIPITDDSEAMEAARKEAEAVETQTKLFHGLKFFLVREVPREPLVFMIRAVGGEVSWCSTAAPGATYPESDPKITHQISDRENIVDKKLGRFYVQPQWIFDSINRRSKLNERDYALGETLPPHLSPFVGERRVGDYVPPEERQLTAPAHLPSLAALEEREEEEEEEGESEMSEEEEEEKEEKEEVKEGRREKTDKEEEKKMQETEEYRLRVMMVKKKHRNLYKSMMKNRKRRENEAKNMERKRQDFETQQQSATKKKPREKKTVVEA